MLSTEPIGRVLSSADGNQNTTHYTDFGCPVLASGESGLVEIMFVKSHKFLFDKIKEIAKADQSDRRGYRNLDYKDCEYEYKDKRLAEKDEREMERVWEMADPDKPDWGGTAGPSVGDIMRQDPKTSNRSKDTDDGERSQGGEWSG